jgi:Fe-S-cluster containining protein
MKRYKDIILRVGDIYKWLDEQRITDGAKAGDCDVCGKCCDLEAYGHRLYVTTPEMLYFVEKLERSNCHFDRSDAVRRGVEKSIKKDSSTSLRYARNDIEMTIGRCRYQIDNKCSVYEYRFAGCRIFCCKGDAGFQSELTETTVKKFKLLCEELQIPYRYAELPAALKDFLTTEGTKIHRDIF